jgi:DNA replication protein DnaC
LAELAEKLDWIRRMRVYLAPKVLVVDEMRYLPMDEIGATISFHLVSARYERGSIILTSNKSYGDDHLDERELYFETASISPSAQVSGGFEIVS